MAAMCVQAIDQKSIHQICSGQVVLSIATAMKELVENSVDAGATNIDIRLKDYGAEMLEVVDNGSGVEPYNFEALTLKHHTSKLRDFSDLTTVETFGFRGEALSSLCALSNLSIVTRHSSQAAATRLEYDHHGKLVSKTPCARGLGTTVILLNLFSTLPVRHKEFLRNVKKEFTKLVHVLQGYCLVSTGVRITCSNQVEKGKKTVVVSTSGSEQVKDNITCVFGPKQIQTLMMFEQMIPSEEDCNELGLDAKKISNKADLFRITGFVSKPNHGMGRSSSDRQFFYINKRPCELGKVCRAVNEVYHMYNRHQSPFIMLDISLARDGVDVNVTPDKRQVFLQEEKVLLAIIKTTLKSMFDPTAATYDVNQKPMTQIKLHSSFVGKYDNGDDCHVESGNLQHCESLCEKHEQALEVCKEATKNAMSGAKKRVFPLLTSFKRKFSSLGEGCEHTSEQPAAKQVKLTSIFSQEDSASHQESDLSLCGFDKQLSLVVKKEDKESCNTGTDMKNSRNAEEKNDSASSTMAKTDRFCNHDSHGERGMKDVDGLQCVSPGGVEKALQHNDIMLPGTNYQDNHCQTILVTPTIAKPSSAADSRATTFTKERREVTVNFSMKKLEKITEKTRTKDAKDVEARQFRARIAPDSNAIAEKELRKNVSKDMFKKMDILGQFNLGFIITKLGSDLFIIDQHASDEKFNFEEQQQNTTIRSQRLIAPQKLELTAVNEAILMDNVDIFLKNGFDFDIDEDAEATKKIKLASLPVSKNWTFGLEDVEELIFMLSDSPGVMCRPSRVRKMFASRACRMSIMVGTALNHAQMKKIVSHMGEIEHPWNCPHGRPTMRHLINLGMLPNSD